MTEGKEYTERECHGKFAVGLLNLVWSLLDKKDGTKEEDDEMVHAAHASCFHWGEIGAPLESERGEWQVSRVHSVLKSPQSYLYRARRCLEICKENNIGDFDIALTYEAMARASVVAGKKMIVRVILSWRKKLERKLKAKRIEPISLVSLKQFLVRTKDTHLLPFLTRLNSLSTRVVQKSHAYNKLATRTLPIALTLVLLYREL